MEYLGVVLEGGQIKMDPRKVEAVSKWHPPKHVKGVRGFLGFTGFYQYFIKDYAKIARPLIELTKKTMPWTWTTIAQQVFNELKKCMHLQLVLRQPNYACQFHLVTDASAYRYGAILCQKANDDPKTKMHVIAFHSGTFTPTERNYDIYEREFLAVLKALTKFKIARTWDGSTHSSSHGPC